MNGLQRGAVLVIGLAMLTVVGLPDRKYREIIDASGRFVTGVLGTAMATRRA